jgi:hypothetical protein
MRSLAWETTIFRSFSIWDSVENPSVGRFIEDGGRPVVAVVCVILSSYLTQCIDITLESAKCPFKCHLRL